MSYMISVCFFGLLWLALFTWYADLRSCMFISSMLFLPAGLAQALFVPQYWEPTVVFRLWAGFDLESLLFAFFTGGIAPALYPVLTHQRPMAVPDKVKGLKWHFFWMLPLAGSACFIYIGWLTPYPLIYAALIVFTLGILHMLIVRPDLFGAAMWGALLFCLVYSGIGIATDRIFPDFIESTWHTAAHMDRCFLGIPAEEYLYGAFFGGLWSMVYCGVFNYRFACLPGHTQMTGAEEAGGRRCS